MQNLNFFLESSYKLVSWLKKFEKVYSLLFISASSQDFQYKLHLLISYLLEDQFFFSACWFNIIIFIGTPRICVETYNLLLSVGTYLASYLMALGILQSCLNYDCYQAEYWKHLNNYYLEVQFNHFGYHKLVAAKKTSTM